MKNITMLKLQTILYILLSLICIPTEGQETSIKASDLTEEMRKANLYLEQSNYPKAIKHFASVAGKYSAQMNQYESQLCADAYNHIGNINSYFENYNKALELYLKGLYISEQHNLKLQSAKAYNNIANIYTKLQDYYQAYVYYKKALYFAESSDSIKLGILPNITNACKNLQKKDEAWYYYNQMISYENDSLIQGFYKPFCKAMLYNSPQQAQNAIPLFHEAIRFSLKNNLYPQFQSSVYSQLGELYIQLGIPDSARYYFQINNTFTRNKKIYFSQLKNLKSYYLFCQSIGDEVLASQLRNEYLILYDSIFANNNYKQLQSAQIAHETEQYLTQIKNLNIEQEKKQQQIETQRATLLILACGVLITAIFLTIVYIQKRKLKKTYVNLFMQNKRLLYLEENARKQQKDYLNTIETLKEQLLQSKTTEYISPKNQTIKITATDKINTELKDELLKQINRIMEETEEFCDPNFSLERLATLVNSNSKYVSLIINESSEKSFRTFLNEYRIKKACMRLLDSENYGNYTIRAIGESVGYKSYTYFVDIFKRFIGIPPSIYQQIALTDKEKHIPDSGNQDI